MEATAGSSSTRTAKRVQIFDLSLTRDISIRIVVWPGEGLDLTECATSRIPRAACDNHLSLVGRRVVELPADKLYMLLNITHAQIATARHIKCIALRHLRQV